MQNFFVNPLTYDDSPDPFVCYAHGDYYAVFCSGERGCSVSVSKSKKLQDVFKTDKKIVYQSELPNYAFNHWAPELHYFEGTWYIYTCADDGVNHHHRVVVLKGTTQSPQDSFVFAGVLDTGDYYSIDASPFIAPNGKLYLMWSSSKKEGVDNPCQLYIEEMESPVTMKNPGERHMVCDIEYSWEGTVNEGSAILIKNGKLYVSYSANAYAHPEYCLGLLACFNADCADYKEWTWHKTSTPILSQIEGLYGPGHNSFTVSPDGKEDWIVYHAKPSAEVSDYRVACAQPVSWNGDNPVFQRPVPFGTPILEPSED